MAIDFTNIIKAFERSKSTLPREVGNIARNHFRQSFRDEGFTDVSLEKWAARKTLTRSDRNYNKRKGDAAQPNAGRRILVMSGALLESINIGIARFDMILIETSGITYGHYHNVGDTRDGVKRQFMGNSHVMNEKITKLIRREVGNFLALK